MNLLEMDLLETKALVLEKTQMPPQENSALHTMVNRITAKAKKPKDVDGKETNATGLMLMQHKNEDEKKAYLQANYK